MEGVARLIEATSAMLWPVAAIAIIFLLLPVIRKVIESREFSLEIGGFKFSAQEATEKMQRQIGDLQNKLAALEAGGAAFPPEPGIASLGDEQDRSGAGRRLSILWVDDTPANNAFEADSLRREGHDIRTALSTGEALSALGAGPIDLVISDMARVEGGSRDAEAGMRLLREMRAEGFQSPFAFYTSPASAGRHAGEAEKLGVIAITSSFTTLSAAIKRRFAEPTTQKGG